MPAPHPALPVSFLSLEYDKPLHFFLFLWTVLDYSLFPKVIGQVLQTYQVRDMHLTFTQGRWLYDEWGYPPMSSAGTGVELWAWMHPSTE